MRALLLGLAVLCAGRASAQLPEPWEDAWASYYIRGGNVFCELKESEERTNTFPMGLYTAIDDTLFKRDIEMGCGACFEIRCVSAMPGSPACKCKTETAVVQVYDRAGGNDHPGKPHFDLNPLAMEAILEDKTCGLANIQFRRVSCDYSSPQRNIQIYVKEGATKWWYAFSIRDTADYALVNKAEIQSSGSTKWLQCTIGSGANFYGCDLAGTTLAAPLKVRLTSIGGEVMEGVIPTVGEDGSAPRVLIDIGTNFARSAQPAPVTPAPATPPTDAPMTPAPMGPSTPSTPADPNVEKCRQCAVGSECLNTNWAVPCYAGGGSEAACTAAGSVWCPTVLANAPPAPPTPPPPPPAPPAKATHDNRLVAYIGNWQACPTAQQYDQYSHVLVSFAVTYTWGATKNNCNQQCTITAPVPVCNNAPNAALVSELQRLGKKVLLSFGGAGMGGSWDGLNDCWEYCYGKEASVVQQLVAIVKAQGFDGVDIDYEYYYEDGQKGSGFRKGAEAQKFLLEVTQGLKQSLPAGQNEVSHAPMDVDLVKGTGYYNVLVQARASLDFIMPQFYNGVTAAHVDGLAGTGKGSSSALSIFNNLRNDLFAGDATKVLFGFCISDCTGTGSNVDSANAIQILTDLTKEVGCTGGAFFWVSKDDVGGAWSDAVGAVLNDWHTNGCGDSTNAPTIAPTPAPDTPAPAPGAGSFTDACPQQMAGTATASVSYMFGKWNGADAVQVTMSWDSTAAQYCAVGFGKPGSGMAGLDIYAADRDTQAIRDCAESLGSSPPTVDSTEDAQIVSHNTAGGKTTVVFARLLDTGNDFVLAAGADIRIAAAVGNGAVFSWGYHAARDAVAHTLQGCSKDTPVPTAAPTTNVPQTGAPATLSPATQAPTTGAPATTAPATPAPVTAVPTAAPATMAPPTPFPGIPATPAPVTQAPATDAPATQAPSTSAPATAAPATTAPATPVPATAAPTAAPATMAPRTPFPGIPATPAPVTSVPATQSPDTPAPATSSPATALPTAAPATMAPRTPFPGIPATTAPATGAPATAVPRTGMPGVPATPSPATSAPATPAPATGAPATPAPRTAFPGIPATPAPVTGAPATSAPRTAFPGIPATPAPATGAPPTAVPRTAFPGIPATPAPATPAPRGQTQVPVTLAPGATSAPQTAAPATPQPHYITLAPGATLAPLKEGETYSPWVLRGSSDSTPAPESGGSDFPWWVLGVVGAVLIVCAAGAFFVFRNSASTGQLSLHDLLADTEEMDVQGTANTDPARPKVPSTTGDADSMML